MGSQNNSPKHQQENVSSSQDQQSNSEKPELFLYFCSFKAIPGWFKYVIGGGMAKQNRFFNYLMF